jgi:hypothetical protein
MNAQVLWKWFEGKPYLSVLIFGIPSGFCFVYAWSLSYPLAASWGSRFLAFTASFIVWPILNWVLLGESMLTIKTLTCTALSVMIVAVQMFVK